MNHFKDLGLAEPILKALVVEGYTTPTPIQSQVIPVMLAGHDIVGIAQTGTGKTAGFVLPLLQRFVMKSDAPTTPRSCKALILAPTRELAAQIADNIRSYSRFLRLSVTVVVGGVKPGPQIRAMSSGVDILVATPGRLLDHMNSGVIRLERTNTVILDEADQMLDLGFMPAVRRILAKVPKTRQTVLMSATMPQQIRALARDFLSSPKQIAVAAPSRPIERIAQSVLKTDAASKRKVLADILKGPGVSRAIVFTRTKRGADKINVHLNAAGLPAAAIHGNKSQGQRERALAAFRSGQTPILVATDIAARGIDVDDISHVINFELPNVAEAYVHRIGRTARAGRAGIAISLCGPAESSLLRDIEKLIGAPLAPWRAQAIEASPRTHHAPNTHRQPLTQTTTPIRNADKHEGKNVMTKGSVKWFNETKGYGFIAPENGGADVFVHISAVERAGMRSLREGDVITYDIEVDQARGKSSAVNLVAA
ncbi:MAG: DEAD/DEAH box helicase [Rhodothalassiaceae bacterium]